MKKLENFLETIDYDKTDNLVSKPFIDSIIKTCNVPIGSQLEEYILTYGYLGYEYLEFYGVNSIQGLESDLIQQTNYLHSYFNETLNFYAFGNNGDGEYILINEKDEIYLFVSDDKSLENTQMLLEDFIIGYFKDIEI